MSLKHFIIVKKEQLCQSLAGKKQTGVIQLPFPLNPSEQVLICLPEVPKTNYPFLEIIRGYRNFFWKQTVHYCAPVQIQPKIFALENGIFYNSDSAFSWKKIPDESAATLKETSFRVAIDLNPHFCLPAAQICKASSAPLRVSFIKPYAQLFFNILVGSNGYGKPFHENLQILNEQLKALFTDE